MTDFYIDNFKLGLDVRKSALTAEPGSLRVLDNCVITQGGEIQKRLAFVKVASLPAGQTQGLHGTNSGPVGTELLYTFQLGGLAPNSTTNLANVALANGSSIPISALTLANPAGAPVALTAVQAVAEYGPQQFFVVGTVNSTSLKNWWLGNLVGDYVGYAPLVAGQKMYRVHGPVLYFSGVGDPSVTNPLSPDGSTPNTVNPGAGFIDTSRIDSDSNYLIGLEAYYKQVAVFSRRVCLLFQLDPDLANNSFQQLLRIGAVSNQSILQFGTGDVLFLSDNGIRSLRVLNASLAAGVTDVGSPIDTIIQAAIAADAQGAQTCEAIIEPISGRYWLAIGKTIYVLSYWPSAHINAWSTFTLPFNVDHMTTAGTKVFIRSGDDVYLYGGLDGATYDTSPATMQTPFMAADTPTTYKKMTSISAAVQGNWAVSINTATDNLNAYELVANLAMDTFSMNEFPYAGFGTHLSFKLVSTDAGPSLIGSLAVRFAKSVED